MLHYYLKRIKGVLCESKHTFFITSRSVHIRTRNISDNICREYQSTHFLLNSLFFENIAAYETMWKNFVQPNRSYVTTFCMHIAYLVPKATNTHSEYVTRTDFPLQQWLKERACVLVIRTLRVLSNDTADYEYNTGCDVTDAEFCVFPGHVTPCVIL